MGPVAYTEVKNDSGDVIAQNEVDRDRVVDEEVAVTAREILETVVSAGTGQRAFYGGYAWGKTGTTDNNGDAWFCGGTEDVTACVWVGHADTVTPMETDFAGEPVDGGTYPALIWASVISAWQQIKANREALGQDPYSGGDAAFDESIESTSSDDAVDAYVPADTSSGETYSDTSSDYAPTEDTSSVDSAPVEEAPSAPAPAPPPPPPPAPVEAAPDTTSGGTGPG
jgi:penicillin-binding protein 1A